MRKSGFVFLVVAALISLCAYFIFAYTSDKKTIPEVNFLEAESESNRLTERTCDYTSKLEYQLKCYWLTVNAPQQYSIQLPIALFQSKKANYSYPDPLVFLAGGPGNSGATNKNSLSFWDDWLARANIERDFVLIDFRGANSTIPNLQCEEYSSLSKKLIKTNNTFAQEYEQLNPVIHSCLKKLSQQFTNGLIDFNSRENANDVSIALTALGYKEWNYIGVSYGSRVALYAALTQPQTQTIILDSPYPFNRGKLTDTPELWNRALTRFFVGQPSDLETMFWRVVDDLHRKPIDVTVEDWSTRLPVTWLLNEQRFIALVYSSLYSSESRSNIASLIKVLADQKPLGVHNNAYELFYNQTFDPEFSDILYFATECNDNPSVTEDEFRQAVMQSGKLLPLFELDWKWDVCRSPEFKSGQLPQMAKINIPVLVAVGELDPITTTEHADELMKWLSRAYPVRLPNASHAEFYASVCGVSLISQFLKGHAAIPAADWNERVNTLCDSGR